MESHSDHLAAKEPFIVMQDNAQIVWENMPRSQRLAYLILARGEFGQLNDASYHMAKAWKEEGN
jgi:hypothetical protein